MTAVETEVLARVDDLIGEAFGLASRIAGLVAGVFTEHKPVRRSALAGVESLVMPALKDPSSRLQGAGFVAGVGSLADSRWWLEWFMRAPNGTPERLLVDTDPRAENFYDYEVMPWYNVPRDTGRRHVTGPYVDYLCTNDYTLTFTVPVLVGGTFVGVAGADVRVLTFEQAVLPSLRHGPKGATVVNAQGRVVLSNSARHVSGTLVRTPDVAALWAGGSPALHKIDDLPLAFVELAD